MHGFVVNCSQCKGTGGRNSPPLQGYRAAGPRVTLHERVYLGVEEAAQRQTGLDCSSVLALGRLLGTPQAWWFSHASSIAIINRFTYIYVWATKDIILKQKGHHGDGCLSNGTHTVTMYQHFCGECQLHLRIHVLMVVLYQLVISSWDIFRGIAGRTKFSLLNVSIYWLSYTGCWLSLFVMYWLLWFGCCFYF